MGERKRVDFESLYELQLIDCNCNDCVFMERDLNTFNKWKCFHRDLQFKQFEKEKEKAVKDAKQVADEKSRNGQLRKANKMSFEFDTSGLISYGRCLKLNRDVSFLPNHCQIETQECFKHRVQSWEKHPRNRNNQQLKQ